MSKHLADHREPSNGGRVENFMRIARGGAAGAVWRGLWQRPVAHEVGNRRVVEYLRIARGRSV